MRRYRLAPSARGDLEGIAEYVADAAGRTVAAQVVSGLREECRMLAETPGEIGRKRDEIAPRLRSFPVPPHVLFFRYTDGEVEVIRILHERQDTGRAFSE